MAATGTTALVGAGNDEDPNKDGAGAAYVFELTEGSWTQKAKLAAADGDWQDNFGGSVALGANGVTALVGAPKQDNPKGKDAGAAYVFDAEGGEWSQRAKLAAADGDGNDGFGRAVAMAADGTTALVGAWRAEGPNGEPTGAAYHFERAGSSWAQQAKLAAYDDDDDDEFGVSVAIASDGTTALAGASDDSAPDARDVGAAYIFEGLENK